MTAGDDPMRKIGAVEDLPQDVQPARDLWPEIESRLTAARAQLVPQQQLRPQARNKAFRTWVPPVALAASIALVVIGVGIGVQMRHPVALLAKSESAGAMIRTALLDPGYQRQRAELQQALPAKLAQLPPESRQRVSASLRSIEQAIQTIESELGRDSGNALLQALLISTCQEEIRVLTAVRDAESLDGRI